jgi:TPR repeat protein
MAVRFNIVLLLWLVTLPAISADGPGVDDGAALIQELEYGEAFSVLEPLASQGDARAQVLIGHMYQYGHGIDQDINKAESWYRKAAEKWDANGMYMLGLFYINEASGTYYNQQRGFLWVRRAAHANNPHAQQFLIKSYTYGWIGLQVDADKAAYWQQRYRDNSSS